MALSGLLIASLYEEASTALDAFYQRGKGLVSWQRTAETASVTDRSQAKRPGATPRRGLVLRRIARDGQRVWAWRHGKDDVGPAFVTERGALDWMARAIDRGDVADT